MQETQVRSPGQEDPLEKEMATHSSILAWRTPWTEESGRIEPMGCKRAGRDWNGKQRSVPRSVIPEAPRMQFPRPSTLCALLGISSSLDVRATKKLSLAIPCFLVIPCILLFSSAALFQLIILYWFVFLSIACLSLSTLSSTGQGPHALLSINLSPALHSIACKGEVLLKNNSWTNKWKIQL